MKIIANNYNAPDIMRIVREWTELSQTEFGKSIHRSLRGVQAFESGERNYSLQTFIQIANTHRNNYNARKERKITYFCFLFLCIIIF